MKNLKEECHKALDNLGDNLAVGILIANDFKSTSILLSGIPEAIELVLTRGLKENQVLRELFEKAYFNSIDAPE